MPPGLSPAFLVSVAYILGVSAGSFLDAAPAGALLFVASIAIVWAAMFRPKALIILPTLLLVAAGGSYQSSSALRDAASVPVVEGVVAGEATVTGVPDRSERYQEVVFRFRDCPGGCPKRAVLARLPLSQRYRIGDTVRLSATLELPTNRDQDFDYRMYLAKEGIGYVARNVEVSPVEPSPATAVFVLAERFEDALAAALPEPESALAAGLILGGEGRLPDSTQESFRISGLSHIVALSGFNIAIVSFYFLMLGVLLFLRRKQAAVFSIAAAGSLVLVAGLPPSGLRALGMAAVMILALGFGRRYGSVTALSVAAAFMLLVNPLLLRYDIGFQFSALATLGIILSLPITSRLLARVRFGRLVAESAMMTVAAELLILPVALSVFGEFSAVAIAANAVLIPIVPLAMLCSFLLGLWAMIIPALAQVFAVPAFLSLHIIISSAEFAAAHPIARFAPDSFGWPEAAIWYTLVAVGYAYYRKRTKSAPPEPLPRYSLA